MALYVTAPGPINESTAVTDLRAPGFTESGPITLTAMFRDSGTVHRDFAGGGRLSIGVSGGTVALPDFTVLRGTTRAVSTQWTDPPLMCICHATMMLPNAAGKATPMSTTIVIFPIRTVALALGALVLLLLAWRLIRRRIHALVAREASGRGEDGR